MNLILEDSKYTEYYTYLDQVFSSVQELQDLNWLISDIDSSCSDPRLQNEPVIIDGKSLYEIIKKERVQFSWAVLSGHKGEIEPYPKDLPFADGNPDFWKGCPSPQVDGAEIEIVCWDSTCTLFINANEEVTKKLKTIFPDIKSLDHRNKEKH